MGKSRRARVHPGWRGYRFLVEQASNEIGRMWSKQGPHATGMARGRTSAACDPGEEEQVDEVASTDSNSISVTQTCEAG